jgi:hypothetical protein
MFQSEMSLGMEQEPLASVRHKICDTVGEIASGVVGRGMCFFLPPIAGLDRGVLIVLIRRVARSDATLGWTLQGNSARAS